MVEALATYQAIDVALPSADTIIEVEGDLFIKYQIVLDYAEVRLLKLLILK